MISSLRGTVLSASGSSATIEVGGVGFSVQVTPDHALSLRVGEQAFLLTSFIVREDSLSLFGFVDKDRLDLFELLVGVTGVGPKSAMGVLAVLSPAEIARAVADDDDAVFRKVSGIGPKTAKLIVVSLTGKVVAFRSSESRTQSVPAAAIGDSVLVALVGLGWPERIASDALTEAIAESEESERSTVPALLRLTLGRLGPAQPQARR